VLKIVDFGVSEMFDKEGEMKTAKSAGSPAFMPPELCVAKHGHVSGRAADIWSMGCTLYCLLFGRIPFEKHGMIELYESIRSDPLEFESECDPELGALLQRLMDKDPQKRITMEEIRVSRNHSLQMLQTDFLGTPMGHATRDGPFTGKVGERCDHH
jgi:[calcium/calmodulin-dependent protein kinase] kinase